MNTKQIVVSRGRTRVQKSRNSPLATRSSPPRGILLLVVLSMLTLFLLIGTAFIVSSDHYRQINKIQAKITATSNSSIDQGDLLNEVINQLIRDTNNQNSTLRSHSLLGDMYGNDGLLAEIGNVEWATAVPGDNSNLTGGQILQFLLDPATVSDQFGVAVTTLSANDNAYNGLVLTFLDGLARGQSVRVVGHTPVATSTQGVYNARLRVLTPRLADGSIVTTPSALNVSRILVNGRPFNGTGVGYNASAPANTARLTTTENFSGVNRLLSLMPNSAFQRLLFAPDNLSDQQVADQRASINDNYYFTAAHFNQLANITDPRQQNLAAIRLKNLIGSPGLGGSDESYDAVDYQNMLLAMLPNNPSERAFPTTQALVDLGPDNLLGTADDRPLVLPSLHRPALINFWRAQNELINATPEFVPNMLRKVMLRPSWIDHPNFSGSNPDFANVLAAYQSDTTVAAAQANLLNNMIYGPWDVDNDNDGIRDSVWVDFGAPVMENSDGKLVKPLAAIMVLDMDGRLNLNAHGSEDIANASPNPIYSLAVAGAGNTTNQLPQGQGYGPAEISLDPLMPGITPVQKWDWYQRLVRGAAAQDSLLPNDPSPAATRRDFRRRRIGKYGGRDVVPGKNRFDIAAQLKMQGVPSWAAVALNFGPGSFQFSNYVTPPDLRGRYALGLNDLGQPVYEAIEDALSNSGAPTLNEDTPYEVDLSLGAARGESPDADDGPFSMAELERILRAYDADAGALPSRIWELAGEFKRTATATTPNLDELNLWRTTLTTDSYDLPVPSVVLPEWMHVGPDGQAGRAGVDDDGRNGTDDAGEIGWSGSDDFQAVMERAPTGLSFADLLEYRIRVERSSPWRVSSDNTPRLRQIQREIRNLLPLDLANGLRLDINRPLGNGRDDNNNGVVDEPGEDEGAFWVTANDPNNSLASFTNNLTGQYRDDALFLRDLPFDFNGDGAENQQDLTDFKFARGIDGAINTLAERVVVHNFRRQMLARDLYVLAMTLADPLAVPAGGVNAAYTKKRAEQAERLAQWAINVVDFRDPDNVMTAFEYDANPFDVAIDVNGAVTKGWSPDGNMASRDDTYGVDLKPGGAVGTTSADQGGLVWGSERPELLITETLGWHDRATENTGREDPANDEDLDGFTNDDDQGTVPLLANESTKLPDSDYDQRLRPKGAAFVELYCPWPENPATNADTHLIDTATGDDLGVNLAAFATDSSGTRTQASPVWRLMMYKDGGPAKDPDNPDDTFRPRLPDRSVYFTGFDPDLPEPGDTGVTVANSKYVDDGVAFFNDSTIAALAVPAVQPGGYLVVGAGEGTGAGPYVSKISSPDGSVGYTDRGISLNPATNIVQVQDNSAQPIQDQGTFTVSATAGVAIINQALKSDGTQEERNFSFSEPAGGYPDRVEGSRWDGRSYVPTLDIPLDDQRQLFGRGLGFEGRPGGGGALQSRRRSTLNDGEIRLMLPGFSQGGGFDGAVRGGGLGRDIEQAGRTIPGFKWVYLQRLANPLLPWNPEPFLPNGTPTPGFEPALAVNPYLTIDSMGANVTVYTGLSSEERRVKAPADPRDPILRYRNRIPIDSFSSLQRGRSNDPFKPADPNSLLRLQQRVGERPDTDVLALLTPTKTPSVSMNLWNPEAVGFIDGGVAGLWKNRAGQQGDGISGSTDNFNGLPDCTLGFLNEPFRAPGAARDQLAAPFSWLTWNNRPFANSNELLQVPAFRASQLLSAFWMRDDDSLQGPTAAQKGTEEKYSEVGTAVNAAAIKLANDSVTGAELLKVQTDGAYGHLLNFFRTDNLDRMGMPLSPKKSGIAGLHRLLDYVHVPSLYVGAETWLNPASFGDSPVSSVDDPRYLFQPPFNQVSSYRDPGRVNLNTIVSAQVWDGGLLHRELDKPALEWDPLNRDPLQRNNYLPITGHAGPLFVDAAVGENGLVENRRGYAVQRINAATGMPEFNPVLDNALLALDGNVPTFFANPFRSSDAGNLVPLLNLQRPGSECTMLRRQAFNPGFDGQWGEAGKDDDAVTPTNGVFDDLVEFGTTAPKDDVEDKDPLFAGTSTDSYNEANRNPYFRYQPASRLSSMTTTRSNVYAVWVTIGFFEIEEAPSWVNNDPFPTPGSSNNVQDVFPTQELYDRVYPEGYWLGQEAGSDTGDLRRVREFAIIDRTVPVAFEPGQNHNVEKAVRLRRRID